MSKLSLTNISHFYNKGDQIVNDISFDVVPSEVVCLAGPSGSGKSTLLRLIAGLENVQSGQIKLGNKIIASHKVNVAAQKRDIGLVFQQPSLFPHLNIEDNICFGSKTCKVEGKSCKSTITHDLLKIINLEGYEKRYPHTLSGGQQQRVCVARCLAANPKLILLDEPFANLDGKLRREFALEIIAVLKKANVGILMVTHDPQEALLVSDKIVLLDQTGNICQIGSPREIYENPRNIDAASFFGKINILEGVVKDSYIDSAIGKLDKKGFAPTVKKGESVNIVTRMNGLEITKNKGVKATITQVNYMGDRSILTATVKDKEISFYHVENKIPNVGDKVSISFAEENVFVF